MIQKVVTALVISLHLITIYCQEVPCTEQAGHSCVCDAPDEEMQQLDCQCEPADGEGHFNCDCWATQDPEPAKYLDCLDALRQGEAESGVYRIKPNDLESFEVYCDMETDGGGWTVFQRRVNGSVDFYLSWEYYVNGFGSLEEEHWLGLSKILRLANSSAPNELRVDMEDFGGKTAFAEYSSFYIEGSSYDYKLHVSGYSGNAGDSLAVQNVLKFSTHDKDNDNLPDSNCAIQYIGAWWYNGCHQSNPNGAYGDNRYGKGINWFTWRGYEYSLKNIQLESRRA